MKSPVSSSTCRNYNLILTIISQQFCNSNSLKIPGRLMLRRDQASVIQLMMIRNRGQFRKQEIREQGSRPQDSKGSEQDQETAVSFSHSRLMVSLGLWGGLKSHGGCGNWCGVVIITVLVLLVIIFLHVFRISDILIFAYEYIWMLFSI